MAFNTLDFILFFMGVVLLYFIVPLRWRNALLLVASYVFYAYFNLVLTLFLVAITLFAYFIALGIEKNRGQKSAKALMIIGVVVEIGILAFYKYFNFISDSIVSLVNFCGARLDFVELHLIVPLGISFIIFQVVSYTIDVYRGKMAAERSLFKVALYVAFFPKVVQGPIERAADIIPQFDVEHRFDRVRFHEGMLMVLCGLCMKMIIADRLSVIVDTVYGNMASYGGATVVFATVAFALQIYCDFAGYSNIAIGTARILGFELMQNFRQPYLSVSVGEFWRRWHISLNRWLVQYLYIPLGGSRCSKPRKYFNLLVTFGLSGLWHGAAGGYVVWGLLNGAYLVLENIYKDFLKKIGKAKPDIDKKRQRGDHATSFGGLVKNLLKGAGTFILISVTWLFFRAATWDNCTSALGQIFGNFNFAALAGSFSSAFSAFSVGSISGFLTSTATFLGLPVALDLVILTLALVVLVVMDIVTDRCDVPAAIARSKSVIIILVYLVLVFAIIMFGVYGYGYSAGDFIYAAF